MEAFEFGKIMSGVIVILVGYGIYKWITGDKDDSKDLYKHPENQE